MADGGEGVNTIDRRSKRQKFRQWRFGVKWKIKRLGERVRERGDIIRTSITDIFRPGSVGRARTRLTLAKIEGADRGE